MKGFRGKEARLTWPTVMRFRRGHLRQEQHEGTREDGSLCGELGERDPVREISCSHVYHSVLSPRQKDGGALKVVCLLVVFLFHLYSFLGFLQTLPIFVHFCFVLISNYFIYFHKEIQRDSKLYYHHDGPTIFINIFA